MIEKSFPCPDCGNQQNIYLYDKYEEYYIKHKARGKTRCLIKRGKIIRQPCVVCGEIKSEGHHPDYTDPYNIMWLCKEHHHEWHKSNKATLHTTPMMSFKKAIYKFKEEKKTELKGTKHKLKRFKTKTVNLVVRKAEEYADKDNIIQNKHFDGTETTWNKSATPYKILLFFEQNPHAIIHTKDLSKALQPHYSRKGYNTVRQSLHRLWREGALVKIKKGRDAYWRLPEGKKKLALPKLSHFFTLFVPSSKG